ncbi:MAG: imidazole glycerol phosphate synthase subunit HisH [Clostridia bacterium]|nr:imidazole glycerol phosphate synthase subunit HisH [Clostridia bacterium]
MISVINYGRGNLLSVEKGLERAGFPARIISTPAEVLQAEALVLPGVGAFGEAMELLTRSGLKEAIWQYLQAGKPFLGICLGLQLLFEASEEWGYAEGLGVLKGQVKKLPEGLKIPHMGWNQLNFSTSQRPEVQDLRAGIAPDTPFYFVHSYYVQPEDRQIIAGTVDYGMEIPAAVAQDNIWGVQFHPEKSDSAGLKLLKNFGKRVKR